MPRLIAHWLSITVALAAAAYLVPGVRVDSILGLALGALAIGLMNALVKPILTVLTLPVTVLTLGLFYFVVNGISFWLAAGLVPGFAVTSLVGAVLGALIVSVLSWLVQGLLEPRE
jgi:putative membrane protein